MNRDLILVIGSTATGKTRILTEIRNYVAMQSIPQKTAALSDAQTIVEHMLLDDERGGHNHYHEEWCHNASSHIHDADHPPIPEFQFPFTVTSDVIPTNMLSDFFDRLQRLPHTGELRYAEFAGGVNINPTDDLASKADLSYERANYLFRTGVFPKEGLRRVLAVIHPVMDFSLRLQLNRNRTLITNRELYEGTKSFVLSDTVMHTFGEDDAEALFPLFREMGIPFMRTFRNEGTPEVLDEITRFSEPILERYSILREGSNLRGHHERF